MGHPLRGWYGASCALFVSHSDDTGLGGSVFVSKRTAGPATFDSAYVLSLVRQDLQHVDDTWYVPAEKITVENHTDGWLAVRCDYWIPSFIRRQRRLLPQQAGNVALAETES